MKRKIQFLIDIIEVTSKDGKYEEIDLDKVEMIEIGDTLGGNRDEKAKTDFLEVDYKMKTLLDFLTYQKNKLMTVCIIQIHSQEIVLLNLERKTMNKGIENPKTCDCKSIASINDIKDLVALVNPEREVSIVVTNSFYLTTPLERWQIVQAYQFFKVIKVNGTSETFYTDHFVVVDDTTLGKRWR